MIVYIDSDNKCHATNDGTMLAVENGIFDGKCNEFIEGYLFVPHGEPEAREDCDVFTAGMAAPWKDYSELDAAQRRYEQERLADAEQALAIMWGGVEE
jgi:hypothetical protein